LLAQFAEGISPTQVLHCAGQHDRRQRLKESKVQRAVIFKLLPLAEPSAYVLFVRPSRDSAVNINITVIKVTYVRECKHEHQTVAILHVVAPFTILWPTVSTWP
jgi:hypothetical protein